MIKVMARVACSAGASLAKRDKHWAGVNGAYVPVMCLANAVSPAAVNRFVGNEILKLEVNSLEGGVDFLRWENRDRCHFPKASGGYLGVRK